MNIIYDFTTRNFTTGRGGKSVRAIIIHDTGNTTDTAKGNANYFRTEYRGASAHYFVDDNNVVQVVREGDTAWHIGVANYGKYSNSDTIGIEMCRTNNQVSEKTLNRTIELVKELMRKYNIDDAHVLRHRDVCNTPCPSAIDEQRWGNFKVALNGSSVAPSKEKWGRVRKDRVSSFLNVRDEVDGNVIGKVFPGEEFLIKWTVPNWYYIRYKLDGTNRYKEGYVSAYYIETFYK